MTVNDSINGASAGITGYSYDLLNRVTKLTQAGTGVQSKRVDMAYNAVNQLTSLSRFSGVNGVVDTSYTYDNNQRLIQLSHKKGVNTIASYDYSYDNADKLATTVSSVDGASSYGYDATNQLTGASHSTQTNEAYAYDTNGNRTSGGTVTSANNQLLSDGTYSYTYDGEGNRTRRTEISTGKVSEYVWDYRNRLSSVLFKDALGNVTKTIDYIYDGNNQRIGKRIDGAVTERYVIDRNQIALVFDGAGTQTHRYLYGTQIDQILTDETATGMVWALADRLGTVSDLVDNSGSVVNHITYDSFGKVVSQTNPSVVFRYGFTGREADTETGLDYYRARYYDASNGRFISEDPIGFAAGDSNLSRYVGNSPTNFGDPTGLQVEENPVGQWVWNGTVWVFITVVGGTLGIIKNTWDGITQFNPGSPTKTPSPKPNPVPTVPPLNPPKPRPTPTPTPSSNPSPKPKPSPLPIPKPDDPNCPPPKKEETCADKYPEYSTLFEATRPGLPFDGFKYTTLQATVETMQGLRRSHTKILDGTRLVSETFTNSKGEREILAGGLISTNVLFENPYDHGRHYNIFISGTKQSAGSAGKYKFCQEGKPPKLVTRFGIFNIKDKYGNKYYERG